MPRFGLPFVILNFAHPLTQAQQEQIAALTGGTIDKLIEVPSQIDPQKPLAPQIVAMVDATGLTDKEFNTCDFVVNLPSLNFSTAVLLAELQGRTGHLPKVLRLRPVANSLPPKYEVAEIIDLWVHSAVVKYRR